MNFELPRSERVTWSTLFEQIEGLTGRFEIADYSLSQTTVEQVKRAFYFSKQKNLQVFLEFSRDAAMMTSKNSQISLAAAQNGKEAQQNGFNTLV